MFLHSDTLLEILQYLPIPAIANLCQIDSTIYKLCSHVSIQQYILSEKDEYLRNRIDNLFRNPRWFQKFNLEDTGRYLPDHRLASWNQIARDLSENGYLDRKKLELFLENKLYSWDITDSFMNNLLIKFLGQQLDLAPIFFHLEAFIAKFDLKYIPVMLSSLELRDWMKMKRSSAQNYDLRRVIDYGTMGEYEQRAIERMLLALNLRYFLHYPDVFSKLRRKGKINYSQCVGINMYYI